MGSNTFSLKKFRRQWLKNSFGFSIAFFTGIELITHYFAITDMYTNAHITSTLSGIILQPFIRNRILHIEGFYE
jgi:hypothetical protein